MSEWNDFQEGPGVTSEEREFISRSSKSSHPTPPSSEALGNQKEAAQLRHYALYECEHPELAYQMVVLARDADARIAALEARLAAVSAHPGGSAQGREKSEP